MRPSSCAPRRRVNGSLVALLTVMKGLPLAYSKDMQEDKDRSSMRPRASNSQSGHDRHDPRRDDTRRPYEGRSRRRLLDRHRSRDWLVREAGLPFRDATM